MASDSARREDHFQKKICPKRTFPSNFVKLVSKILYLFLAEKMVVCCLLFVVCCLLFVVCCLLFVVCCLLFVVCCLLFVVCCLLFVVCCLLFVVCCLLLLQFLSDFGLLFF